MLVDALVAADPVLKLSDAITNPERYLHLTDSVVEEIERSTNPVGHFDLRRTLIITDTPLELLAESRALLHRLRKRNLYKQADLKVLPSVYKELWGDRLTPQGIANASKSITDDLMLPVSPEDIIVDWTFLHMGMKEQDPMKLVRFFQKQKPNGRISTISYFILLVLTQGAESFIARTEEGSQLIATCWQELMIRVFTRDPKYVLLSNYRENIKVNVIDTKCGPRRKLYSVQQAFRALVKTLPDHEPELPLTRAGTPVPISRDPHTPILPASFGSQQNSPSPQGSARRSGVKDDNQFTTVPPNYQASPPPASLRWKRSRSSLGEFGSQLEPPTKKR